MRRLSPPSATTGVLNLTTLLSVCDKGIQECMVWHFTRRPEYGRRVAEDLGMSLDTLPDFTAEYADRI